MTVNTETYKYHTATLTIGHPLHAGKECYCKNCSTQLIATMRLGSIYCKICEDQQGEVPFIVWLHQDCPETGCGEHCLNDEVMVEGRTT
jgi:hypothetical protein